MAYFGGSQGRGDPGFFGSLFRGARGAVSGFVRGGPLASASGFVRGITAQPPRAVRPPALVTNGFLAPQATGTRVAQVPGVGMVVMPKRRRMNVANPKALRRAIRRQNGFVTLAKGALKNSGFKVVSVSAGKVSRATMDKAVEKARHSAQHHS